MKLSSTNLVGRFKWYLNVHKVTKHLSGEFVSDLRILNCKNGEGKTIDCSSEQKSAVDLLLKVQKALKELKVPALFRTNVIERSEGVEVSSIKKCLNSLKCCKILKCQRHCRDSADRVSEVNQAVCSEVTRNASVLVLVLGCRKENDDDDEKPVLNVETCLTPNVAPHSSLDVNDVNNVNDANDENNFKDFKCIFL